MVVQVPGYIPSQSCGQNQPFHLQVNIGWLISLSATVSIPRFSKSTSWLNLTPLHSIGTYPAPTIFRDLVMALSKSSLLNKLKIAQTGSRVQPMLCVSTCQRSKNGMSMKSWSSPAITFIGWIIGYLSNVIAIPMLILPCLWYRSARKMLRNLGWWKSIHLGG